MLQIVIMDDCGPCAKQTNEHVSDGLPKLEICSQETAVILKKQTLKGIANKTCFILIFSCSEGSFTPTHNEWEYFLAPTDSITKIITQVM